MRYKTARNLFVLFLMIATTALGYALWSLRPLFDEFSDNPAYAKIKIATEKYNKLPTTKEPIEVRVGGDGIYFFHLSLPGSLLGESESTLWIKKTRKKLGNNDELNGIKGLKALHIFGNRQGITYVAPWFEFETNGKLVIFDVPFDYAEPRESTAEWLDGWTRYLNAKIEKNAPPPIAPIKPEVHKGLPQPPH